MIETFATALLVGVAAYFIIKNMRKRKNVPTVEPRPEPTPRPPRINPDDHPEPGPIYQRPVEPIGETQEKAASTEAAVKKPGRKRKTSTKKQEK